MSVRPKDTRDNLLSCYTNAVKSLSSAYRSQVIFSQRCRERYLHGGGRNYFETAGIEMGGLSDLTAGYTVERSGYPEHVLLLTLKGRARLRAESEDAWLEQGRLALLPAGASYHFEAGKLWRLLWFHFRRETIWDRFFGSRAEVISASMQAELCDLAERFLAENLRGDRSDAPAILDTLARLIVLYLQRELESTREGSRTEERIVLEALWRDVAGALGAPWTIASLGRHLGWSRTKLQAYCSRFYGCGAMERVTRLRMEHAGQRMRNSTAKLAEIAPSVGYEDVFAFSKAFKRVMGVSPRVHRIELPGCGSAALRISD